MKPAQELSAVRPCSKWPQVSRKQKQSRAAQRAFNARSWPWEGWTFWSPGFKIILLTIPLLFTVRLVWVQTYPNSCRRRLHCVFSFALLLFSVWRFRYGGTKINLSSSSTLKWVVLPLCNSNGCWDMTILPNQSPVLRFVVVPRSRCYEAKHSAVWQGIEMKSTK